MKFIRLLQRLLLAMLSRRGWAPDLSFGAFYEGRLVSFTLNGTGTFKVSREFNYFSEEVDKLSLPTPVLLPGLEIKPVSLPQIEAPDSKGITLKGKQFEMIKQL